MLFPQTAVSSGILMIYTADDGNTASWSSIFKADFHGKVVRIYHWRFANSL